MTELWQTMMAKSESVIEFLDGEPDRVRAILTMILLEEHLRQILQTYCRTKDDSKNFHGMFERNGALSTAHSRIEMCYYLGLIHRDHRRMLGIFKKVRNEFAHNLRLQHDFTDQPFCDWIREFLTIPIVAKLLKPEDVAAGTLSPAQIFTYVSGMMGALLGLVSMVVSENQLPPVFAEDGMRLSPEYWPPEQAEALLMDQEKNERADGKAQQ